MVVEHQTQDQEQELSELLQIRRDKLDQLRELGIDPLAVNSSVRIKLKGS